MSEAPATRAGKRVVLRRSGVSPGAARTRAPVRCAAARACLRRLPGRIA